MTRSGGGRLSWLVHGLGLVVLLAALSWSAAAQRDAEAEGIRLARLPLVQAELAHGRASDAPEGAATTPSREFPTAAQRAACGGDATDACAGARVLPTFYPPEDAEAGRALVRERGTDLISDMPPARLLLVVSWYAGVERASLADAELAVLAAAEATLLGAAPGADRPISALIAGIESIRQEVERRGATLPARALPSYERGENPASIDLGAEVLARTSHTAAADGVDPVPPLAAAAGALRRGESPDAEDWTHPGLAGLLALEAVRQQAMALRPAICEMVASPPSFSDQLAGLWALKHLGLPSEACDAGRSALERMGEPG